MNKNRALAVFLLLLSLSLYLSQKDIRAQEEIREPRGFSLQTDWFGSSDRLEKLDILRRVLNHIEESYVDPQRVSPNQMLIKALDELSQMIPEVRILYPDSNKAVLMVDQARLEIDTNLKTLYALHSSIADVLKFIRSHKTSDISDRDLEVATINGVLSTLDPHSVYLTSDLYSETKVGTTGKFGGLGIVIGLKEMKLTIIAPLENTPAFNAGLKAGDQITKIGDEPTTNMSLSDAVNKMRGPKGSTVVLGILRTGWPSDKTFTLVRDIINVVSVDSDLFPSGIGYVRIKNFQGNTAKDLSKHLREIQKRAGGNLSGLILDLRSDPGGLLDQAIQVTDKFLSDGVIVSTVGAGNRIRDEEKATGPGTEPDYPMAVLVDQGSASASEIVAGALKRRNRAILIGQRTFGKGTVQSLYDLPEDSALKLTIAQYLTPGDYSIQSIGITPDINLIPATISKDYINLYRKEIFEGEVNLERHFDNPQEQKRTEPQIEMQYLEKLDDNEEIRNARAAGTLKTEEKLKDFVTRVAFELLKNHPQAKKDDLLEMAKNYVHETQSKQKLEIQKALLQKGIDWADTPTKSAKNCGVPKPTWKISNTPKQQMVAGETVYLEMTLANPGPCTLYQSRAETDSKTYLLNNHEFLFGKISPNASVTRKIKIVIPKSTPSALAIFNTTFFESRGILPPPMRSEVLVQGLTKPQIAFSYEVTDRPLRQGMKSNGILEKGETLALKLIVKNLGNVRAENLSVSVKPIGEKFPNIRIGRGSIEKLNPKDEKTLNFEIDIPENYVDNQFILEANLIEPNYRIIISKKLPFHLFTSPKITSVHGFKVAKKDLVSVYPLPSTNSPVVAYLKEGQVVKAIEQFEDFYMIELSPHRRGWVLQAHIDTESTNPAASKQFNWVWLTPPKFEIDTEKLTSAPVENQFLKLAGGILDQESAKDFFVLVNGKKVFYQAFPANQKPGTKQTFDATIPLESGPNRLVFVGRNEQDILQQEAVVVQRNSKEDAATTTSFSSDSIDPLEP